MVRTKPPPPGALPILGFPLPPGLPLPLGVPLAPSPPSANHAVCLRGAGRGRLTKQKGKQAIGSLERSVPSPAPDAREG